MGRSAGRAASASSSRRRALASGAAAAGVAAIALSLSAATAPACFTHQCDSSCVVIGGSGPLPTNCVSGPAPESPRMEGAELVWESSPAEGPWLDFGAMRTLVITYPQPFASTPLRAECDIAADVQRPQDNFVPCGGNLAQFVDATAAGMIVKNPNCAGYGLRLVMRGPWIADGGDASPPDSSSE